jgi:D-alanyl-D-alanine carboxypeptidase
MPVSRSASLALAAFLLVSVSLSGPARAGAFSAMVADIETGSILTAEQIDAPRDPVLISRLATITMGIQDIADETLQTSEDLDVRTGDAVNVMTALQATALGEDGYRAPMTALAARIGYNAKLFEDRIRAIGTRVGLRATTVKVVRGADGGPAFEGRTTLRDTVRLATSLLRAHGSLVDEVFAPATGNLSTTRIWMAEDGTCLLVARGPMTGRDMVAGLAGAPSASECFEAAAVLLAEQDQRIIASR